MIALTGTPGVGKTTVSKVLEKRGFDVLDLNGFIRDKGLLEKEDPERKSFEVDIETLKRSFNDENIEADIIEGHLSHHLPISTVIVLRCSPSVLEERMENKGWDRDKIEENLEAEMIDIILMEALQNSDEVLEIDTTDREPVEVASSVEEIMEGKTEYYKPGSVDWSGEMLSRQ